MPCLGRARAQPQPTPGRLLRDLPEPVSSAQPGSRLGSPGAWVALAVVEPLSAPADSRRVGVSTSAIGTPVMRHLFQRVCRPMASEQTTGAFRFGLRLMAIDGTLDEVADTPANVQYFGRMSSGKYQSPFPQVRCVYLAEVGTHAIIDAVFAPCRVAEQRLAPLLLSRAAQPGMLVLMDRGIVSAAELSTLVQQQAHAPLASESQRLHPCRAGALRWQLVFSPYIQWGCLPCRCA